MFLKNNSENSWLQYDCGGSIKVDIAAGATIEVSEAAGKFLLKNLGAPNWLVEVEAPETHKSDTFTKVVEKKKHKK